jgi:hypothetical protein
LKAEIIGILLFLSTVLLFKDITLAKTFAPFGTNEIILTFSLVFTFAVGLEVLK